MKRNIITIYENLSLELKKAIDLHFPYGYEDEIIRYLDQKTGKSYRGLVFNYKDTHYLIKFKMEQPIEFDDEIDEINKLKDTNTEL